MKRYKKCIALCVIVAAALLCAAPAQQLSAQNTQLQNNFAGHELDVNTGLLYMNSRYYNSALGKFTSIDPAVRTFDPQSAYGQAQLANPQLQNSYSYAASNPLRYKDPTGALVEEFQPFAPYGATFGQGEVMGEYRGVTMYSGGFKAGTLEAVMPAQCVSFVKNFARTQYGVELGGTGNAANYAEAANLNAAIARNNPASNGMFTKFENGSAHLPGENDIISWTGGQAGHVGIVAETVFDHQTGVGVVYTLEQNTAQAYSVFANPIVRTVGGQGQTEYSMMKRVGLSLPVSGWLRYHEKGSEVPEANITVVQHSPASKPIKPK